MEERVRNMEERVANVEGAIKLLTDILAKQDEKIEKYDEKIEKYDEIIARLDKRGEEQQKMLVRLEANQIVLHAQDNELKQTLNSFMKETKGLFIQAGGELRDHENRIQGLEDK